MEFHCHSSSLTTGKLSIGLPANSITDSFGIGNEESSVEIDFRPHRVAESDLILWWALDEGSGNQAFDSSIDFDPSWTPSATLSELLIWLDAGDTSSIQETGGVVSQWNDKSGSGNHLTPNGSSDPMSGTATLNELNVIEFDGNDILTTDSLNDVSNSDQTWFIVAKLILVE